MFINEIHSLLCCLHLPDPVYRLDRLQHFNALRRFTYILITVYPQQQTFQDGKKDLRQ